MNDESGLVYTFKPLYLAAQKEAKMWQDAFIKAICAHTEIDIPEMGLHYRLNADHEYVEYSPGRTSSGEGE